VMRRGALPSIVEPPLFLSPDNILLKVVQHAAISPCITVGFLKSLWNSVIISMCETWIKAPLSYS